MNKLRLLSTGFGVSLIVSIATPGYSQTNTSNVTGANTSNSIIVNTSSPSGISTSGFSQSVINQAQQLSNELKAAAGQSQQPGSQLAADREDLSQPRRFARRASASCEEQAQAPCPEAKERAEKFLESIKNPTPEQLESQMARSRQLW